MVKRKKMCIDADQCTQSSKQIPLLWTKPPVAYRATLILAHGAGAAMDSPFMTEVSDRLAARGIAVVRFEFPYMAARREDARRRPPNPAPLLLDYWRAVYRQVRTQVSGTLAIGGKSMGGRIASMLADELKVDGLVCLGYPFHPAGKPEKLRVAHLAELRTPSLIVQGERDAMGSLMEVVHFNLSAAIRLQWLAAANHDLKPLKASGFSHAQHLDAAADAIAVFLDRL